MAEKSAKSHVEVLDVDERSEIVNRFCVSGIKVVNSTRAAAKGS